MLLLVSLLAMVRGTSRWATPMKAIVMTVFLFELGIRFAKSPVAVRSRIVRVAASKGGESGDWGALFCSAPLVMARWASRMATPKEVLVSAFFLNEEGPFCGVPGRST